MPKEKRYYYECVFPDKHGCEVGYWGPDQRRERWPKKGRLAEQPMKVLHTVRFFPSNPDRTDRSGMPIPGDILCTARPIGRQWTEETVKNVSRPKINMETGQKMLGRVMRPKISRQKFRLMEDYEIDRTIIERCYFMNWIDDLYKDGGEDVHLPKDAKQAAIEAQKPEPAAEVDEAETPAKGRKRAG